MFSMWRFGDIELVSVQAPLWMARAEVADTFNLPPGMHNQAERSKVCWLGPKKPSVEWSQNEQKETWELITEYTSIFAMSDMDLGKASLVKHSIRLTDNTPFKECYQQIPSSMYEEVREHLKEMLQIGAIWQCHSPWAIPVILVCKKDG